MESQEPQELDKTAIDLLTDLLGALMDDSGVLEMRVLLREGDAGLSFARLGQSRLASPPISFLRGEVSVIRAQRRELIEIEAPAEFADLSFGPGAFVGEWFVRASIFEEQRQFLLYRRHLDEKVSLDVFAEERAMPAKVIAESLEEARTGNGVCIIGPNAAHNQRVVSAFANALSEDFCVQRFSSGQVLGEIALTTEVAAAARILPQSFVEVVMERPDVMWVAALLCPSIAAAERVAGLMDCAPHLLYFAAPEKTPVLLERHSSRGAHVPAQRRDTPIQNHQITESQRAAKPLSVAAYDELPPIPELGEAPPSEWAVDDADHDIPSTEALPSSQAQPATSDEDSGFLGVLKSVRDRPTFTPLKPSEHPQARSLKDKASDQNAPADDAGVDPFGGLTFGAPPRKEDS